MLRLLIDTCVWLDLAKGYRHQPTLHALETMVGTDDVGLIVPRQTVEEFAQNKDRIIRQSGRSLSTTLKRVKEAVRAFGDEATRDRAIAVMDDVDHRIVILGEATNDSIARTSKLFPRLRSSRRATPSSWRPLNAPSKSGRRSIGEGTRWAIR